MVTQKRPLATPSTSNKRKGNRNVTKQSTGPVAMATSESTNVEVAETGKEALCDTNETELEDEHNDTFATRFSDNCNLFNQVTRKETLYSPSLHLNVTRISPPCTTPPPLAPCTTPTDFYSLHVKQRLIDTWTGKSKNAAETCATDEMNTDTTSLLQQELFPNLNDYMDLLFTNQTHENTNQLRHIYSLHVLNHIYKTRDKILKNTLKLKHDPNLEFRDQGFTRPRVLILTPFKNDALSIINTIISLSGTTQHDNLKRFQDEFGIAPEDDIIDEKKPQDFKHTFAGNIDDCFRIGIRFARKAMKLYSEFYSSDILVCSPLGLRMIIGTQGDKKRDFDFLSSIEIVILDKADVFMMQNWDHIQHIFAHLNLIPAKAHDTDFSRIKSWYLDEKAPFLRQTIILSSIQTPVINSLFSNCKNVSGNIKYTNPNTLGIFSSITAPIPHLFQRFNLPTATSPSLSPHDARYAHFTTTLLPQVQKQARTRIILFIPSYFDYIRVRNYMTLHNFNFRGLSEYSTSVDVSRARLEFYKGEIDFMVITERFHFFKRYVIRGGSHVVFYALPDNTVFYKEVVESIDIVMAEKRGDAPSVTTLWCLHDVLSMSRLVGKEKCLDMCDKGRESFLFNV